CPPSVVYRLRKFTKRHRGPVLAATAVVLALAAAIVGVSVGLVAAREQWGQAEKARANEAEQRRETNRLLLNTQWKLYGSQIDRALQTWESNYAELAYHHLETCRPDFRDWEHDYLFTLFYSHQRTCGKQRTLDESPISVTSVAVTHDGKR